MATVVDDVVSAGKSVGANFSVVGVMPALGAAAWCVLLISMGAWTGPFDPAKASSSLASAPWALGVATVASAFLITVLVHPFQFEFTQWLEGYWGTSRHLSRLAARRINKYRRIFRENERKAVNCEDCLIERVLSESMLTQIQSRHERMEIVQAHLAGSSGDSIVHLEQERLSALRSIQSLPAPERMMPTRLGNALRGFEDSAGRQYGLDVVAIAPLLMLLDDNPRSKYVSDTRQGMDLAVRVVLLSLVSTAVTALLLADDGLWVLLAFGPYAAAYLAYRGAVTAALAYGNAVRFQIVLDRFTLYEKLHGKIPAHTDEEVVLNEALMLQLRGSAVAVQYVHPSATADQS